MKNFKIIATASASLAISAPAFASSTGGWLGPIQNLIDLAKGSSDLVFAVMILLGVFWCAWAIMNVKKLSDDQPEKGTKAKILTGFGAGIMAIYLFTAIDFTKISFLGQGAKTSTEVQSNDYGL
jgi:hypothetical protein